MIKSLLLGIIILFIAVLMMGVKIFFTKKGEFPNTHIGGNKAMKERGISCATTQAREALKQESIVEKLLAEKL